MILQLNPQSLLFNSNSKSLLLGLELKSGPSHLTWSSHLTVPAQPDSGAGAGAAFGPLDPNRSAHSSVPLRQSCSFSTLGSKSDGGPVVVLLAQPPPLALSLDRGREWVAQRRVESGQRSTGLSAMHLLRLCAPPPEVHTSPTPVALIALWSGQSTRSSLPLLSAIPST